MSDERFDHGLVIGKFYPPHAGHHLLIDAAAERCDRLTVVVLGGSEESIPTQERVGWLTAVHASQPHVAVVGEDNDNPVDFDDPDIWSLHVAVIETAIARAIVSQGRPAADAVVDAVFSSEAYGPELGRRFGAAAVAVDVSRTAQPISGTAVRADVVANWSFLAPPVRAGLALRVVVREPDSSGPLVRGVADRLRARGGVWSDTQVVPRARVGDEAAAGAGSPVLLCATGDASSSDLCLLSDELTGAPDDQVDQAVRAIDDLVATAWQFVEPRS